MPHSHFRKPIIAHRTGHPTTTTVERVQATAASISTTRSGTTTFSSPASPASTRAVVGRKRNRDEDNADAQEKTTSLAPPHRPTSLAFNRNAFTRPQVAVQLPDIPASKIRPSGHPSTEQATSAHAHSESEYSQRKLASSTPTSTIDPLLSLSHVSYGLPPRLVQNFAAVGVKSIYPWQSKCLRGPGILSAQKNLVYTAPTGGGKSLVADVLMLKKIIENPGKKAILVLPYVALVQEKLRWLRSAVEGVSKVKDITAGSQRPQSMWRKRGDEDTIRVVGVFGGSKSRVSWADVDIAVCTIEKANSLVNAAIEDCTISNLGVMVLDEIHMLDDDHRGYIMELMATKLLALGQDIQIIGMSATLSNTELLAKWLKAKFFISTYRPVPIEEHLVYENSIYPASSSSLFYKTASKLNSQELSNSQIAPQSCRVIEKSEHKALANPLTNAVVALANETARSGYGALVFCSSRAGCEADATLISQALPILSEIEDHELIGKRLDLLTELRSTSTGLDRVLRKTIPRGVAFHHAGLTTEERDLVASAYDSGVLKVIVATCSLAAGINLPARRVILHGARMGRDLVGPSMLRQMRGRAGRKGKDEIGETYLCCQKTDLEAVAELMTADIPRVESCLMSENRGIDRALLEAICTKLATSEPAIDGYIRQTLLYHSTDSPQQLISIARQTIDRLINTGLIMRHVNSDFGPTLLGQAVVASSLTPGDGVFIHQELKKALQAFVMDGEMHVLYAFTPVCSIPSDINWRVFSREIDSLDESGLRALRFVGINPAMVNKMAQGGFSNELTSEQSETARIYRRFYAAFQLRDLCNEVPIHVVARKYDIPRGSVQNLAQTCHGFAAGMIKFCERMGWGILAAALDHMSDRLRAGAKSDLLALAEITFVKSRTARIFWDNGLRSVGAIAAADVKDIVPILLQAQPRKIRLDSDAEDKYAQKLLTKAEIISKSANRIWEREMQQEMEEE